MLVIVHPDRYVHLYPLLCTSGPDLLVPIGGDLAPKCLPYCVFFSLQEYRVSQTEPRDPSAFLLTFLDQPVLGHVGPNAMIGTDTTLINLHFISSENNSYFLIIHYFTAKTTILQYQLGTECTY